MKPLTEAPVFPSMEEIEKSQNKIDNRSTEQKDDVVLAAPLTKQDIEMDIPVEMKKGKKSKKKNKKIVT